MTINIKRIIVITCLLLSFNYLPAQNTPNSTPQNEVKNGELKKKWKTRKSFQSTNDSYSKYTLPDSLGIKKMYGFASFEDTSNKSKNTISLKPISIELYDIATGKMTERITFLDVNGGDYYERATSKYIKLLKWLWANEIRYKKISMQTQKNVVRRVSKNPKGFHIIAFKTNP